MNRPQGAPKDRRKSRFSQNIMLHMQQWEVVAYGGALVHHFLAEKQPREARMAGESEAVRG